LRVLQQHATHDLRGAPAETDVRSSCVPCSRSAVSRRDPHGSGSSRLRSERRDAQILHAEHPQPHGNAITAVSGAENAESRQGEGRLSVG
jgi:hypothetical protein